MSVRACVSRHERVGRRPRTLPGIFARRLCQHSRLPPAYFTGIITYALNVTVYYFIWSAVFRGGQSIAGYNLAQMITYISVGWIIRSFYTNTIDQEMAYEMIEGSIAMNLIKPVSVQWMWVSPAPLANRHFAWCCSRCPPQFSYRLSFTCRLPLRAPIFCSSCSRFSAVSFSWAPSIS